MKLEVGMYVRTRYGIAKITNLSETIGSKGFYLDREIMECNEENWKSFCTIHGIIAKPKHNIIDLVQVGDYVNGLKVYEVKNDIKGFGVVVFSDCSIHEWQIKSILTKEQFESMSYKVGE